MTEAEDHGVESQLIQRTETTPKDRRRQIEEHVRRWQSSGLTQAEYCRRNHLKWSTFHYWKKRLATSAAATLVQVPVGFNANGSGYQPCQGLTLVLGDRYKVEIGDNFNPSTLARLVDTLGQL
jgi:anti-sigma-K factor RskA